MPLQPARSDAQALVDARTFVDSHRDEVGTELFGITELCAEFGVTLRALRFYEDKGLLSPRRVGAARVYTRRDRARLTLILRAKAIGSPLSEIKRYLDLYGDHGEGRVQPLDYVIAGTDTAIETADVALMDDDLRKIPAFIRLSRATHSVLVQNIVLR